MTIIDLIGLLGVSIILTTYFLLQIDKINAKGFYYSFLNAIGSILILFSLSYNWNLPSVVIEVFWFMISLLGLYKYFRK